MDYGDFIITDEQAEKIAINVFNDILLFVKERKENTKDGENINAKRGGKNAKIY